MRTRRLRSRRGFTLVEVIVATMISAMMVTAFFSVALTSRVQTGRADHKLAANQAAQRMLQKLKNYVVDSTRYTDLPNNGRNPDEKDTTTCVTMVGGWALSAGLHDVTCALRGDDAFYDAASAYWKVDNASMKYCVADAGTTQVCAGFANVTCPASAAQFKCVAIKVYWTEKGA